MPTFKVAHIREQGQDMLLFPLSNSFGIKPQGEQSDILAELEMRAHAAGLGGRAVAVWQNGSQTRSLGPTRWQAFLRSINMRFVQMNVNKSISW